VIRRTATLPPATEVGLKMDTKLLV
jgi:hypothetical protein